MNTEVLWGGGLWWGLLRTSAPTAKHVQQVLDVDHTVAVCVTCTWSGAVIAQATFAEPGAAECCAIISRCGNATTGVCLGVDCSQRSVDQITIDVLASFKDHKG